MEAFQTTREREGYDGIRNGIKWWFEAWGQGRQKDWTKRGEVGRPPRPRELRDAEYVVVGATLPNGHTQYRTRRGGLDL